jgi:hypothetical protein
MVMIYVKSLFVLHFTHLNGWKAQFYLFSQHNIVYSEYLVKWLHDSQSIDLFFNFCNIIFPFMFPFFLYNIIYIDYIRYYLILKKKNIALLV